MNYRHAYHAGNHGDVLKHAIMIASIERLHEKPAPILILDTHAGIGTYDLTGAKATKTGEWQAGIGRLLQADAPALASYIALIRQFNPGQDITNYPGSPAIAEALLRRGDRLVLSELHPDDAQTLRNWTRGLVNARGKAGIAVHQRDAYEILNATLPPPEKRGLIIVDPPYEVTDEYERLAKAIIAGHRRWPGGRWMIWHPVKDHTAVWRLQEALIAGGVDNLLAVELLVKPADGVALAGSGILLVNPAYGIEPWLRDALPQLQRALAPAQGSYALRWIAGG